MPAATTRGEDWFRQIVESAPSAFIVIDGAGRVVLANAEAQRMFGYTAGELVGESVDALVPERYRAGHAVNRGSFLAAPRARPMGEGRNLHARRRDGSEFPVEIGLSPIETGEGLMVLAAVVDISVRRRLEERFRLAVEAAPSGIVIIDAGGRIVLANAQMERMFGFGAGELAGTPVDALVPERFRAAHPGYRGGWFTRPGTRPMGAGRDLYARRRDGSEFPVEIGLNPLETDDGPMVLAVVVDITARKHADETIRASLREKEILLQEVYHRVKNNLQVLGSLLDMQARAMGDGAGANALRESVARVRTMAMAHEMLYRSDRLGGIDFGSYVRSLVTGVLAAQTLTGASVGVEIESLPLSMGIEVAVPIGLVLNELVSNSLKHGYPGGGTGRVRIALEEEGGGQLRLTVRDDGAGLPPGFEPRATTTLGLRLVHALIGQIGGRVEFLPGPGVCVRIGFARPPEAGHVPPVGA